MRPDQSLINQGSCLGLAYITLVWLRERFAGQERNGVVSGVERRFDFGGLTANGPRAPSGALTADEYLELLRNAISHGHVEFQDNGLTFKDRNRRTEPAPTVVEMTWEQLSKLIWAVLDTIQCMVNPLPGI